MALFGPNFTNALSAGFQGQDLAEQMKQRALQTQQQQMAMRDAEQKRAANALMGQVLQAMMAGGGQGSAIPLPQGAGAASPGPPGTVPPQGAPGGAPMPQGTPAAAVLAPLTGGQPQDLTEQMRQRAGRPAPTAPKSAGGVVDGAPEPSGPPLTWPGILDSIKQVAPNAPPALVTEVVNSMAPMVLANQKERYDAWKAQQDLDLKDASRLDKLFMLQQQLDFRYATTQSAEEKSAIQRQRMALQEQIANITAGSRESVAATNAAGRLDVAGLNAQSRQIIAEHQAGSRERIASDALTLKRDLGEAGIKLKGDALDIEADKIANTKLYRERTLDLREKGLDQQAAANQAKLDMTMALATMRDGTTRRGQDMVSGDKKAAIAGKLDLQRGKAANGVEAITSRMDDLINSAQSVLEDENLDRATGTIAGAIPSVRQGSVDFDAKLDSLRSEKGLSVIQALKDASATGGSGFSRITNFELQQMQNSIGSLKGRQSPAQLRENLLKLINFASQSKTRLFKGYETLYGAAGSPGGTGVPVPKPDAAGIPTPESVANEPDGTVFKMGGKTYTKKGAQSVETAAP